MPEQSYAGADRLARAFARKRGCSPEQSARRMGAETPMPEEGAGAPFWPEEPKDLPELAACRRSCAASLGRVAGELPEQAFRRSGFWRRVPLLSVMLPEQAFCRSSRDQCLWRDGHVCWSRTFTGKAGKGMLRDLPERKLKRISACSNCRYRPLSVLAPALRGYAQRPL